MRVVRHHRPAIRGMRGIHPPVVRTDAIAKTTERLVELPHLCIESGEPARQAREIRGGGALCTAAGATRRKRWIRIRKRVVANGLLDERVRTEPAGICMRSPRPEGQREQ